MEQARKEFADSRVAANKALADLDEKKAKLELFFEADYAAKLVKLAADVGFTPGHPSYKYKEHEEGLLAVLHSFLLVDSIRVQARTMPGDAFWAADA